MHNPEIVDALPACALRIPEYCDATFECTQIEGDRTLPAVYSGDWISFYSVL